MLNRKPPFHRKIKDECKWKTSPQSNTDLERYNLAERTLRRESSPKASLFQTDSEIRKDFISVTYTDISAEVSKILDVTLTSLTPPPHPPFYPRCLFQSPPLDTLQEKEENDTPVS
ncbi:hypothetical protein CDAR_376921 [Caerostris darwini]|uniref:Uncharacterized protein n=1 Tax=Caerostris darwini TaxID=1538125 RepID=A0AAV4STY9_9ARAC|nr:hypothetical protein CDAR_376921 [Caerostris darwini]